MTRKQGMYVIPPCEEAMEWTSRALDSKLSFRQRILLKLHLRLCTSCNEYHEQVGLLRRMINKLYTQSGPALDVPFETLSSDSKERMKKHIEAHNH